MNCRRVLAALTVILTLTSAPSARAQTAPVPADRPGPPVLHSAPPRAPQLENAQPVFVAPFDRVSGTDRYTAGEYLYTDFLYDDSGSGTQLTYPTDHARFGGNAADLVEFRLSTRVDGEVAVRFTLNTLLAEDTTMAIAAFDVDVNATTGSSTLPQDPGSPFPGTDAVVAVWGTGATWSTWSGDGWTTTPLAATADLVRNQLVSAIPASNLGVFGTADHVRTTVALGLHDTATHRFLRPAENATATHPGGGSDLSAIFNLAFRFDERITTTGDALSGGPDVHQADALSDGEPTRYAHDIDLAAIRAGTKRTTVPTQGPMIRFFPSRLVLGEGRNPAPGAFPGVDAVLGPFPLTLGQLQPYSLYVPSGYEPDAPSGLTLNLHSLGARYWQYIGTTGVQQLGEQRDNLVLTPDARGPNSWYEDEGEYDVFEAWADVAAHYNLDPARTYLTGYSMGGYGTYRLGLLYPDLFARAASVVGPPAEGVWLGIGAPLGGGPESLSNLWLENARNLPFMNVVGTLDELVPIAGTVLHNLGPPVPLVNLSNSFDSLGYRYDFVMYPTADHIVLGLLGYDLPPVQRFLGDHVVERDPLHVTLAYTPATDNRALGLVHNKAYWIRDLAIRDPNVGSAPLPGEEIVGKGVADVRSLACGFADPESTRSAALGTEPIPYVQVSRTWATPPAVPVQNALQVDLENVSSLAVDAERGCLDPAHPITLHVTSDGPGSIRIASTHGGVTTLDIAPGTRTYTVSLTSAPAADTAGPPAAPTPDRLPATGIGTPLPAVIAMVSALALLHLARRPSSSASDG